MPETLHSQAAGFHARERRRSFRGLPDLHRTHRIAGTSSLPVALIDTSVIFPSRDGPVAFHTVIRITENSGTHEGLVFELGGATRGVALWVEDEKIGFHAGATGTADGAQATFDYGAELAVGRVFDLVVSALPGDGRVRMWDNGNELARGAATNATFDGAWAGTNDGSFASAPSGTIVSEVPAGSQVAPDGFEVIAPLSVYINQSPRHFI